MGFPWNHKKTRAGIRRTWYTNSEHDIEAFFVVYENISLPYDASDADIGLRWKEILKEDVRTTGKPLCGTCGSSKVYT